MSGGQPQRKARLGNDDKGHCPLTRERKLPYSKPLLVTGLYGPSQSTEIGTALKPLPSRDRARNFIGSKHAAAEKPKSREAKKRKTKKPKSHYGKKRRREKHTKPPEQIASNNYSLRREQKNGCTRLGSRVVTGIWASQNK